MTYEINTEFFSFEQETIVKNMYLDIIGCKFGHFINNISIGIIIRIPIGWFKVGSKVYVLLYGMNGLSTKLLLNDECLIIFKKIYEWMINNKEEHFKDWKDYSNYDIINNRPIILPSVNTFEPFESEDIIDFSHTNILEECDPEPISKGTKRKREN